MKAPFPIAVGYQDLTLQEAACALAAQLDLAVDNQAVNQLRYTAEGLALCLGSFSPLIAHFDIKHWQHRRNAGKQQGLVRACKPSPGCSILDATAGWGRDAAILASFGANVCMLERHPVMAALLEDALQRQDPRSREVLQLSLKKADALDYLLHCPPADYPDVIYLDPMHPERAKASLVKKDLQALQQLIGPDQDAKALLDLALTRTRQRVVVKWPQSMPALLKPDWVVPGKTVRFDVYVQPTDYCNNTRLHNPE